jgi:hypothetical protein
MGSGAGNVSGTSGAGSGAGASAVGVNASLVASVGDGVGDSEGMAGSNVVVGEVVGAVVAAAAFIGFLFDSMIPAVTAPAATATAIRVRTTISAILGLLTPRVVIRGVYVGAGAPGNRLASQSGLAR